MTRWVILSGEPCNLCGVTRITVVSGTRERNGMPEQITAAAFLCRGCDRYTPPKEAVTE